MLKLRIELKGWEEPLFAELEIKSWEEPLFLQKIRAFEQPLLMQVSFEGIKEQLEVRTQPLS
jgi:hypothetical protein